MITGWGQPEAFGITQLRKPLFGGLLHHKKRNVLCTQALPQPFSIAGDRRRRFCVTSELSSSSNMSFSFGHFGRRKKGLNQHEREVLAKIQEEQKRDLSNHVVDAEKLRQLAKDEEYILETQKCILDLYDDVGERQAIIDKRIKKLREKNSVGRFKGDYIENLESWDGNSTVAETDDPFVADLQSEALAIVKENWETKCAIDTAVEELYDLELKLMQLKVDKAWEPLKDLPPKNLMPVSV
ncbi:hypothetical protein BIW11_10617 [Tropilaelaps mercedesae]|uniref:Uncharacterized protein n=1 Tax=Tropilaelaps mercedesae TaxID=418985 RepID=A0A1V9XEU3_9ACAR|nr:hypothetical protein BIW11_10617 [Tropilaelaps mercedesae]